MHKLVKIALGTGLVFMQQPAYPMQALQKLVQKSTQSAQGFFNKAAQTWLKNQGALGAQKTVQVLGKQPKTAMLPTTLNNPSLFANFGKTLAHNQSQAFGLQAVRAMNYQHNKKQLPLGTQTTTYSQLSNNKIMHASAGLWTTMYVKGLRWWYGDDIYEPDFYRSLTNEQQDVVIADIAQEIKQGTLCAKKLNSLHSICWHLSEEQKNILCSGITEAFKQNMIVEDLDLIYSPLTEKQKNILFPFIVQTLQQGKKIKGFCPSNIYIKAPNEYRKNILLPDIVQALETGKEIESLGTIYNDSTDEQRKILLPSIGKALKQGRKIEGLGMMYLFSTYDQKNTLLLSIAEALKQGKNIDGLRWIYEHSADEQRDILLPFIVHQLNLFWTYEHSTEKQRDILLPFIVKMLNQGEKIDGLARIYARSTDRQRNILFPSIIGKIICRGDEIEDLNVIYSKSTKEQRKILLPEIIKALKEGKELKISNIYYNSTGERDILFPHIIHTLKEGKKIYNLSDIYYSSTEEQKKKLLPYMK